MEELFVKLINKITSELDRLNAYTKELAEKEKKDEELEKINKSIKLRKEINRMNKETVRKLNELIFEDRLSFISCSCVGGADFLKVPYGSIFTYDEETYTFYFGGLLWRAP